MTITSLSSGWVNSPYSVGADSYANNEVYDSWQNAQAEEARQQRDIPREMMEHSGSEGESTSFDPGLVEMVNRMIF